MKQKSGGQFIAILIGFVIISLALFQRYFQNLPDGAKGVLVGIGIAIMASPIVFAKCVQRRSQTHQR